MDPLLDAAPIREEPETVEAEVEPDVPALHSVTEGLERQPEPQPSAIDTHCHLFLMEGEPVDIVAAARAAGVGRMVCVGIDPGTSRRSAELAQSFRGVFATAGTHPHTASEFDRAAGAVVEELVSDPLVVGIGETGLDYYRRLSPVEDQQRAFRTHIALSRETGKPLVVHVRDAWPDAMRILEEDRADRVILHCFSGDAGLAREAQARGYFISFAANLTYPSAGVLREAAAALDDEHMLVETDSPFLPPQPRRGEPNTPANLIDVIEAVATVRERDAAVVTQSTARAALSAFPLVR